MTSKYFNQKALNGLNRIGDIILPENGDFPSFSQYGGAERVDDLVAYAPREDVATLNTVLGVFSFLPEGVLKWIVDLLEASSQNDGPLGSLLRQLNMGLRGILFSLYYGRKPGAGYIGVDPLDVIGYAVERVED